jgi:hypothetical protein
MNPFIRKRVANPGNPQYYFTAGDVFNGGAEHLAFESVLLHPLQGIGGIVAGSLRVTQPPQIYQSLALPLQPFVGGIGAGSYQLQALTDAPSDAAVQ